MDKRSFINYDYLQGFDGASFRTSQPFPWASSNQFLNPEGFQALLEEFPGIEWFERHEHLPKPHFQRPHNRYYLAYEKSLYHPHGDNAQGTIKHVDLPRCWQSFIKELDGSQYRDFIKALLGVSSFKARYAWHIGVTGSEVSPHCDAGVKAGTHIFYFNTSNDWMMEWGGTTLVLGDKQTSEMNPEFEDFNVAAPVPFLDNHSFLFKNTDDAWHGVRALICPAGRYRRSFNVIFEFPAKLATGSFIRSRLSHLKRRILQRL